jgi:hypothetical protein
MLALQWAMIPTTGSSVWKTSDVVRWGCLQLVVSDL